jgi:hypothetical protein
VLPARLELRAPQVPLELALPAIQAPLVRLELRVQRVPPAPPALALRVILGLPALLELREQQAPRVLA